MKGGVVLVCGSRYWEDYALIAMVLSTLPRNTTVIHGDCRGADRLAGKAAEYLGMKVRKFPADWKKHGPSAGPKRNQQMLDEGKPGIVYVFHDDIESSKGSKDMKRRAEKAGIKVNIYGGE